MKSSWTICGLLGAALLLIACATKPVSQTSRAAEPAAWPDKLDAVIAAPDNHRILLENDRVRVLEVTIKPKTKEPVHAHRWPSVLYIDKAGDFIDYEGQGKVLFDSRTAKEPIKYPVTQWLEAQAPHAVENLSAEPVHLIRVELKR
jgi:quercetin dioxygenase-like cupin family protein